MLQWSGVLMVVGLIGCLASAWLETHGLISFFFIAAIGSAGCCLTSYRNEHGLWILASLFLLLYSFIYVVFVLGQIRDALRGAVPDPAGVTVDFAVGLALLATNIRFLIQAARYNWCFVNKNGHH